MASMGAALNPIQPENIVHTVGTSVPFPAQASGMRWSLHTCWSLWTLEEVFRLVKLSPHRVQLIHPNSSNIK